MLDLFNTPTPQNCNFQEFYNQGTSSANNRMARWVKPRGCSMVRFLLIAGGGGGGSNATLGGSGGGSSAITSLIIPAMFVPDSILVQVGQGGAGAAQTASSQTGTTGTSTIIYSAFTSSTPVTLLSASGGAGGSSSGTGGAGGSVASVNYFSAAGILQSVTGQAGANANTNLVASSTIPLTGGAGGRPNGSTRSATPNYGYPEVDSGSATKAANGYFQLSPILLGCGGGGGGDNTGSATTGGIGGDGGIGCGGGGGGSNGTTGFAGGKGGNGAVFIWAW